MIAKKVMTILLGCSLIGGCYTNPVAPINKANVDFTGKWRVVKSTGPKITGLTFNVRKNCKDYIATTLFNELKLQMTDDIVEVFSQDNVRVGKFRCRQEGDGMLWSSVLDDTFIQFAKVSS